MLKTCGYRTVRADKLRNVDFIPYVCDKYCVCSQQIRRTCIAVAAVTLEWHCAQILSIYVSYCLTRMLWVYLSRFVVSFVHAKLDVIWRKCVQMACCICQRCGIKTCRYFLNVFRGAVGPLWWPTCHLSSWTHCDDSPVTCQFPDKPGLAGCCLLPPVPEESLCGQLACSVAVA